ncbi:MAG: hypothetical protein MK105_18840 [Crocinitomicaceae bacterium]|nr:hypothetical protein [Crocinitomicaceae bacterium]
MAGQLDNLQMIAKALNYKIEKCDTGYTLTSLKTNKNHYSPHYNLVHVAHALKLEIFDLQSELNRFKNLVRLQHSKLLEKNNDQ